MASFEMYKRRRAALVAATGAPVLLVAGFEDARVRFHQESSFFYYTGIHEPGTFCLIDADGTTTLFVPHYATDRAQWVPGALKVSNEVAQEHGIERFEYLGAPCKGYVMPAYFDVQQVEHLLQALKKYAGQPLYTMPRTYVTDRLCALLPDLARSLQDVRPFIARMRRLKSQEEIEALYNAVDVTMIGHEAAARALGAGKNECQVAAAVDYIFTESHAQAAFPSIVASGPNANVLHYNENCREMRKGECVIVDIGACLGHYCGDLTRTYPISGAFTKRQKEVYTAVLATQQHLAAVAKPGMWLRNDEQPEHSLHHIMHQCLRERGFADYIAHGVGHFLGLDVHDVGDTREALQVGDVITIEPGVYIPEEALGIRIEDDYWIVQDGAVCLSEALPSEIAAVEALVQQNL